MTKHTVDLRQSKRIFFSDADNTEGAVVVEGMSGPAIPIKFLNLSEGGISFQAERSFCPKISWDQIIRLTVAPTGCLAFLDNSKVEVKYVLDYDIVPQITFGCQFIELSKMAYNEINKIIEARLTPLTSQF